MSSSVKPATQSKASNPSVSLANSAWSKGPPQTTAASNSSRAQSPASNAPPGTHSRRQSTLGPNAGQGAVKPVTIGRGVTGPGHRPTNSISFGSVDAAPVPAPAPATPTEKAKQPDLALAAPSLSIAAPQPPAPAPAATPAQLAQAPEPAPAPAKANGIKVVAPTPTQPAPVSNTPATSSAAITPPASTSTPKPKKALNVHALFQGGGGTPVPPVVAPQPPASAPVQPPAPSAPTGPNAPRGPGFPGRDAVPFPRSPQIPRPPLAGTQSGSGGPRPAGSPRMGGASMPLPHHQQHHPQHAPHMQPQWGPQGYYYPQQAFDPYMHYWQQQHHPPHPHQHQHIPPHMHNPPMQPSPRIPSAQPRPPSTPPVSTTSPHPPAPAHAPPPISTHIHNPVTPSAPSPATGSQLNTAAAAFVPGGSMMRPRASIRISTPDGSALSFEGAVPPSPKVSIGMGQGGGPPVSIPKRQPVTVRMESAEEKNARLAKEKEEKEKKEREEREKKEEKERLEREAKEKEEKEREEKERKEREEREAKERAEREEHERIEREAREKEEQERKAREEKERLEREEKERVEREKAEAEAKAKAEEEARLKAVAEAEAKAKAEVEAKAKEEAEAKARAEAEAAAAAAEAKAKEEAEAAAKAEAEAEEQARAEAEAKAKAEAEAEAAAAEARDTVSPVESPKPTSNGLLPSTIPERPSPLSISTTASERPKRPVPGPLDLSSAQGNRSAAPPSALASARIIEDLNMVPYPEAIKTPNPDLNIAATPGKFRYDREFLLQFMNVCKEKPDSLPPLDAIGLEPGEQGAANYPGGARQGGRRVGSMGMSSAPGIQRQGSIGLGLGNVQLPKSGFSMGSFQAPPSRLGDSQSRFEASSGAGRGTAGIPFPPGTTGRLTPMTRSASQGGVGGAGGPREAKRTRSQRGNNRGDNMRASGFQTPANQMMSLEPVAPLEQSENRWVAGSTQRTPTQIEARALVERKVKSLLNKLTMDKFDSISDQIIEWANKSEQEKDGSTLMQVIRLIFEKAKDEAGFSEMYARLCRKMMERVSPNVQDETIRSADGQPITGGLLFRKYLLNRCQEDFERGWSAKEAAAALAASKAGDDKAAEAAGQANGEAVLYSEEYYAAAKAKRQGLGLVRFIGELFKLQMLTERIMHECIKKLLSNVVNPEEEEIESLCKLLTTVGQSLDNAKARNHMDIYFERMQEMARGNNINSRMQFMLQDVIELRHRHWQVRSAVAQPSTIAAVHEQAKRDEAASRSAMQRGGSRRGEHRDHGQQADGWNVAGGPTAARPPAKAGDLSQFGKISKSAGLSFGPTSVFNKKDSKQRDASLSRASSNVNMFAALGAAGDGPPQPEAAAARGGTSSRKPSMDLGPGGAPAAESGVRKRLNLLPRTKPAEAEADKGEDEAAPESATAPAPMSEADAQKKVKEDIKEYLGVENVEEAIMALETLPIEHRYIFVDKMVGAALDGGNKVVVLAEKLFAAIHKQQACSAEAFERGLLPTVEMADDMSIDVPKTYEWLARLMHAAGIDRTKAEELAEKISVLGEPMVQPRDLLMQEFDKA